MKEIVPGLWISDIIDVREKPIPDGITTVVSVCQDTCEPNISDDIAVVCFPLADDVDKSERFGGTTSYQTFKEAADFIHDSIVERGRPVLCHCHAGQNRSVSVCTAVIGRIMGGSYDEAFDEVLKVRPIANPTQIMERHAKRYVHGS